jgi:hypothetical protein
MHTKNGKPLQVSGTTMYTGSGQVIGRLRDGKLFGRDGRYVGTVVEERLVFRSTEAARVAPAFAAANCGARAMASLPRSAVRGDEPVLPD